MSKFRSGGTAHSHSYRCTLASRQTSAPEAGLWASCGDGINVVGSYCTEVHRPPSNCRAEPPQVPRAARNEPAIKVQASPPVAREQDEILQRVLPDVPAKASQTIRGRIKVNVHVRVNESGNVAEATLKSAGPSKYFAGLALQAAQRWRLTPTSAGDSARQREWMLDFEFSRAGTKVAPVRMAR